MNTSPKHSSVQSHKEHGTAKSYVIGYILSLLFTVIPYYLVVNKTITGTTLLAVIIGIAIVQMFIQIFFFLHLGRGPKPLYNIVFFGMTVVTIFVVVVGSIWIMNHLNYNMAPTDVAKYMAEKEAIPQLHGAKTGACKGTKDQHRVILKNGIASPSVVLADMCDSILFVNEDETPRVISFGSHTAHGTYSGVNGLTVKKGRNKSLTLNQTGTHYFHDHLETSVNGLFTVASE